MLYNNLAAASSIHRNEFLCSLKTVEGNSTLGSWSIVCFKTSALRSPVAIKIATLASSKCFKPIVIPWVSSVFSLKYF